MTAENMRVEFENAVKERFGDLVDLSRVINGDGEYMHWDVIVAWQMWQAAMASQAVPKE